jgi:hypothetical protein
MPPYRTIPSNEEPQLLALGTLQTFNFLASLINGNHPTE